MENTKTVSLSFLCIVASMWLGHFLVDLMIGVWSIYKTIAHIDIAFAGLVAGFCAFAGEGMQIVFGPLSDKGYTKPLIIGGLLGAGASSLLPYTENYWLLFLLVLLTCTGSGSFHPAAATVMGELSHERKGFYIALFTSGGAFGLAASQWLFTQCFFAFEGHTFYLAIPIVFLVIGIYFLSMQGTGSRKSNPMSFKLLTQFFAKKELTLLYIAQVCNQTIMWGTVFLLPDLLLARGYDTWLCYGVGHFSFFMGGALMMVPAGYLADRFSFRTVLLAATTTAMCAFYLFLFSPPLDVLPLLSLLFLMGSCLGAVNPLLIAFGHRLLPSQPGLVSAVVMGLAWCVSESIGPGGGGYMTTLFEYDAPAKALGILGIFFLLGLACSFSLPAEEKELTLDVIQN